MSNLSYVNAAAADAFRALHLGEDLRRLRQLAIRWFLTERVRVPTSAPGPASPAVELALRQPERSLDVAFGAALIAAEDQPELEPVRVIEQVEEWSSELDLRLRAQRRDAESRLATLNEFFFEELGMAASPTRGNSRYDEDRLADLLLPHVIRRRRGHCLGPDVDYQPLVAAAAGVDPASAEPASEAGSAADTGSSDEEEAPGDEAGRFGMDVDWMSPLGTVDADEGGGGGTEDEDDAGGAADGTLVVEEEGEEDEDSEEDEEEVAPPAAAGR